jgi:hypothetical protein
MIKPNEVKLGFGIPDVQGYSVILDYYSGTQINSDRTSSVPLAQYWKDYPKRLLEIEHQTGLRLLHPQIHFEYATESFGNSNASMSDVMILADGVRVAIEAKFTEFANYGFQTIAEWLSESTGNNKMRVLDHWVGKIAPYSEGDLTDIEDIPYQFLHRLSCACDKHPEHAILLYQLFIDDETRPTLDKMLSVLTAAKDQINPKSNLKILFQQIECKQVKHYKGEKLKSIFSDIKSERGGAYLFPGD